jgi:hypothetical protein
MSTMIATLRSQIRMGSSAFAGAICLLTSLLLSAEPTRPLGVPPDAVQFKGNWYRVYVEDIGWRTSVARCKRLGGHLAIVPDQETQDFLKKLANGRKLHLGATNEPKGIWTWIDGTPMKFQAWERGQPNSKGYLFGDKAAEHYLAIGPTGNWWDVRDNNNWSQGYICQWPAK